MKIDKDIPIPDKRFGRRNKYPFKEMEIGDSVYLAVPESRAYMAAFMYAKRHGIKFRMQSVKEGGLRVWRIS